MKSGESDVKARARKGLEHKAEWARTPCDAWPLSTPFTPATPVRIRSGTLRLNPGSRISVYHAETRANYSREFDAPSSGTTELRTMVETPSRLSLPRPFECALIVRSR